MEEERMDTERGARAVLVALNDGGLTERALSASLDELSRLLDTVGGSEAARVVQNAPSADPKTYIGSGKAKEIAEFVRNDGNIDLVVFDNELSPSQIRNLEDILDVRVIDRTMLILDIFALHAVTGEGKLQVEIACLRYSAPRLTGKGKSLSRQGGTSGPIGSRGPGESKLELDRRHLHHRIEHLEGRLKELEKRRGETRRARQKNNVPVVALVGYTNVGKSSLLNALCGEQIFEADMLFATLDPTARKLVLPSGLQIILVDTVGFVSRLPHHLVEAFKSTLEEAAFADVIVKVADAGDAQAAEQLAVTDEVLGSLDCADIPQLVVYNKCDTANTVAFDPDILLTSAKTGYGLPALLAKLDEVLNHRVRTIEIVLPYDKLALADILRSRGSVAAEEYREDGVYYRGTVKIDDLHRFEEFLV
uniref:GTPase HflX n=1 Tax=Gemmiger formicilis TaxID=745368 RepID=UPI00402691F6